MTNHTLVERLEAERFSGRFAIGGGQIMADGGACQVWGGEKIMELVNPDGPEAAARICMLEEALREMVYETTSLSPCKPNGDHDCTIRANTLANARQALTPYKHGGR